MPYSKRNVIAKTFPSYGLFIDTPSSGMALRPLTGMVLGYTGLVPHEFKKKLCTHKHMCVFTGICTSGHWKDVHGTN